MSRGSYLPRYGRQLPDLRLHAFRLTLQLTSAIGVSNVVRPTLRASDCRSCTADSLTPLLRGARLTNRALGRSGGGVARPTEGTVNQSIP